MKTDRVKQVLERILKSFETGEVPEALKIAVIPRYECPSNSWSLNNRLTIFFSGTSDARGFRQWKEAGRWPQKGSKAIYILSPRHRKIVNEEKDEEKMVLTGFLAVPVFAYEQTEGAPLERPDLDPPALPPLFEVAQRWGISVSWESFQGEAYGFYSPGRKKIVLATHEEQIFFHELGHAAHEKVVGSLAAKQDWKQEIVAELTASVLAHLYGRKTNAGGTYHYIRHYAEKADKDPYRACMSVIADVERCLQLIIQTHEEPAIATPRLPEQAAA